MDAVLKEILADIKQQLKETNELHHEEFGEGVDFGDVVSVELPAYMWVEVVRFLDSHAEE